VPEPRTAKVRIHLDIQVDDIGAARQQVEDLRGRWSGERHDYDDGIVMVMHGTSGTCDASRQAPVNLSGVTTDLVFCLL
jgi:hypothetical protein